MSALKTQAVEFVCEAAGHAVTAPSMEAAPKCCPAYVRGRPCRGDLKRVGAGSRGARK